MIEFNSNMKVMIGISHIDFRTGINRLVAVAQSIFDQDPNHGVVFVFRNRRKTDIKLIFYDGNGFFLGHKRLSKGKLAWWPRNEHESVNLCPSELTRLLKGVDPRGSFHPDWQVTMQSKPGASEQRSGKTNSNSGRPVEPSGTYQG
jgi:transposase